MFDRLLTVSQPVAGSTVKQTFNYSYDYRTRRTMVHQGAQGTVPVKYTAVVFSGGVSVAEYEKTVTTAPGMGPGLETRGVPIEGGRKIKDTLPEGITDVKNAQGDVFKSVHTPPSAPHAGMSQHVHPNYRNVLPDGSVRSGVSKAADPLSRQDIIDATRPGAQRTGGN